MTGDMLRLVSNVRLCCLFVCLVIDNSTRVVIKHCTIPDTVVEIDSLNVFTTLQYVECFNRSSAVPENEAMQLDFRQTLVNSSYPQVCYTRMLVVYGSFMHFLWYKNQHL